MQLLKRSTTQRKTIINREELTYGTRNPQSSSGNDPFT